MVIMVIDMFNFQLSRALFYLLSKRAWFSLHAHYTSCEDSNVDVHSLFVSFIFLVAICEMNTNPNLEFSHQLEDEFPTFVVGSLASVGGMGHGW